MTVKFTNNASTTVGTGINASATSLTVASASSFPSLSGADDYCYLTLQGATNTTREVVKATALSGNTFTIVRAQDNTSATSWVAGDIVELRMTAALLTDVIDAATVEGVKTNYQYTPTAGQTVFSGADNASATMIINQAALVSVYMNGVRLVQGTDYSVSSANNTVTLGIGATTADIIDIEVYGNFVGQSGAAVGITGGSITGTAITATSLGATGTATLNTLVSNNATISGGSLDGVTIGGTTRGAISGNAISGTSFASTGNMTFGDNNKAIFGAGSDLQIYHDGSHSYVSDTGTGYLRLKGSNYVQIFDASDAVMANFESGGSVYLAHNGVDRFATTATGIDVTGTVSADQLNSNNGKLFLDDNGSHNGVINAPASLYVNFDSDNNSASEKIVFGYDRDGTSGGTSVMEINSTGIDVTGTVTADGGLIEGSTGLTIRNDAVGANEPKLVFDNDTFAGATYGQIQTGNGGLQLLIESPSTSTFQNRHQLLLNGGGSTDVTFKLSTDNGTSYKNQLQINNNDISFYEDTGTTPKLTWSATNERLTLTGSDYQFNIQQGANQPWYMRAVSDGTFRLHLNGTGDIITASATGIDVTGAATFSGALTTTSGMTVSAVNAIYNATGTTGWSGYGTTNNGGGVIIGLDDGATFGNAIGTAIIRHSAGKDFVIKRDTTDELRINGSTGAATFSGTVTANGLFASNASGGNVASFTNTSDADLSIFLTSGVSLITPSTGILAFGTSSTERLRIDSAGKIQIGNNIPMWSGSYGGALVLKGNNATSDRYAQLAIVDSTGAIAHQGLIVDTNGNAGIGNTGVAVTRFAVTGAVVGANIETTSATAAHEALIVNRQNSDGVAIAINKAGATVGSIGTYNGVPYIGYAGGAGGGIMFNGASIEPTALGASRTDGANDIGSSTYKWKDLFLSGGVVFGDAGGSGTPTSNTFDSYEEGTSTILLSFNTTNATITQGNTFVGYYTKVGNVCTVVGYTGTRSFETTGAGNPRFSGLPFASKSGTYGIVHFTHNTFFTNSTAGYVENSNLFYRLTTIRLLDGRHRQSSQRR
jgi:hypothetical protein